eukprot:279451_1
MSAVCMFEIHVYGKRCRLHTGIPQTTNDIIVAISHLTQELHSIVSKNIDPLKSCLLTIKGLSNRTLYGTMRWFEDNDFDVMMERVRNICLGIENSFNVKIEYKTTGSCPAIVNTNKESVDLVAESVHQVLPLTKNSGIIEQEGFTTLIVEVCYDDPNIIGKLG